MSKPQETLADGTPLVPPISKEFNLDEVSEFPTEVTIIRPSSQITGKGIIDEALALQILEKHKVFSEAPNNTVSFLVFTTLLQEGGTNRSKKDLSITIEGKTYMLLTLKQSIMAATNRTVTVRQLGRTLNDKVGKMAVAYNIPGPLVRELEKMTDEPIPAEDRPYCNEIFSQNPNAPEYKRDLLLQREEEMNQRMNVPKESNQQTKPRRRRMGK